MFVAIKTTKKEQNVKKVLEELCDFSKVIIFTYHLFNYIHCSDCESIFS